MEDKIHCFFIEFEEVLFKITKREAASYASQKNKHRNSWT